MKPTESSLHFPNISGNLLRAFSESFFILFNDSRRRELGKYDNRSGKGIKRKRD
jgi:hypothetical protein